MNPFTLGDTDFGPVYAPAGDDPVPGVVVLHGSEGPMAGWSHRFAVILAAHGYAALPYAYGEGDFWAAGPIRGVDLRRTLAAVAHLADRPGVTRAGLFGWSRGAEHALLVAALAGTADPLACVAAHAASNRVNAAFEPEAERGGTAHHHSDPAAPRAWTWEGHDDRLAPGTEIEIERYPGPVFLSVGDRDIMWDPAMTRALAARLEAAGRPADLFVASGQGHGFDFDREPELWARLDAFFRRTLDDPAPPAAG